MRVKLVDPIQEQIRRHGRADLTPREYSVVSEAADNLALSSRFDQFLRGDEEHISNRYSDFAEMFLTIDREPFSLAGRDYLRWAYDVYKPHSKGSRDIVLIAGRQVEKSTTLAGKTIVLSAVHPAFKSLTIEPRYDQVKVFSNQRFRPMCEDSEVLDAMWMSSKCQWQVGAREFINGSFINFRSCYYSADPIRGITAHNLIIDELEDIISDNIPILEECQTHIPEWNRFNLYAGTPKTTSNTLNQHWKETCQFEWLVKCVSCGHWNFLDDKVIGPKHYICAKCGKQIYPRHHGRWIAMRPSKIDERWGFRISQLMVPFITHADVVAKMNDPTISRRTFFNECLGLSYDEGQLALTEADIRARCEARVPSTPENVRSLPGFQYLTAGLDHGTGGYVTGGMNEAALRSARRRTSPSYTVLAIGAVCSDGKFRVVKIYKFTGEDAEISNQPRLINEIVRRWGVQWVMSDWGFGFQTNSRLIADFGWTRIEKRGEPNLMEIEYVRSRAPAKFDQRAYRYVVDRNFAIETTVDAIKKGTLWFFRQEEMEPFIDDFTTMYVEYNDTTNRVKYDHVLPDDAFHAVGYAHLAARQLQGRLVRTMVPVI